MGRPNRSLCIALTTVCAAAAQDPVRGLESERERTFGLARSVDGQAWAGATVVLFARPVPGDETVGVADRVEAITDPRGRFHAAILPGLTYSAWAWRDQADGSYRSSQAVEGVVPRQPVLLTRSDVERRRGPIRLVVADGVVAPIQASVRAATRNVQVIDLAVGAESTVGLPRLPAAVEASIEVFDGDGVRLVSSVIRPERDPPAELAVPARVPIPVLVRDVFSEAAPAHAYIALLQRNRLVRLGDLGADGCGTIQVPAGGRDALFAFGSRRAAAPLQPSVELAKKDGTPWPVLREGFEHQRHAHVGPGLVLRGRVVLGPERPVAGGWIAIDGHAMHYMTPNSRSLGALRRSSQLGADGRFAIDHVLEEYPPSIQLVLGPDHLRALPDAWRIGLSPVVPAILDLRTVGDTKNNVVRDAGDIDLLELVPARLSIRTPDGVPAIGATVRLIGLQRNQLGVIDSELELTADQTGTVALLLPRRDFIVEVAAASGDLDVFTIHCDPGERLATPVQVVLALREPSVIRGQLVDFEGRPLSGHALQVGLSGSRRVMLGVGIRREPPVSSSDDRASDSSARSGPLRVEAGFDPATGPRIGQQIARAASGLRTDADGRFEVRVPPIPLVYSLRFGTTRVDVAVDGERDPEPLRIELGR